MKFTLLHSVWSLETNIDSKNPIIKLYIDFQHCITHELNRLQCLNMLA